MADPTHAPVPAGRIVDEVFSPRHRSGLQRWAAAIAAVVAIYGVAVIALPFFAAASAQEWASALAARVPAELGRERDIAIETPPPPPPPAPEAPPPAAAPPPPVAVRS